MLDESNEADELRAAGREDRARLQRFVCTTPTGRSYMGGRSKYHPAPWELDVQSWFRNRSTPLKSQSEQLIVFGREGEIAAASHYGFMDDGSAWLIRALASSVRFRGQGYGHRILQATIELCERDAPELPITARIHDQNEHSAILFGRSGFTRTDERVQAEPMMRVWVRAARDLW